MEVFFFQNPVASSTETTKADQPLGFIQAFIGSFSVIVVSELGDKTFFIAAIMAMRHPRVMVFLGAILALAFMTVLSGNSPDRVLVASTVVHNFLTRYFIILW